LIICATAGARQQSGLIPPAPVRAPQSRPRYCGTRNGIHPEGFTIDTVPERLARLGSDPWTDIAKVGQSLNTTVRRRVGI
jgi:DNA primase